MDDERLRNPKKEPDVFQRNRIILKMQEVYGKLEINFSKSMIKLGTCIIRTMKTGLSRLKLGFAQIAKLAADGAGLFLNKIGNSFVKFVKNIAAPVSNAKQCAREIDVRLSKAKKSGTAQYLKELLKCVGKFYSRAGDAFSSVFNYAAPVVSFAFLIGIINYSASLEYGFSIEYNGQEIGVVSDESEFNDAAKEVQKRIAQVDGGSELSFSPEYSLKILDGSDSIVNSSQLADKMLISSDAELVEACGIYVDGEFIGAVDDKNSVSNELANMLADCETNGNATNIRFTKEVAYESGLYLKDSLTDEQDLLDTLKSFTIVEASYIVQDNDTPVIIAQKCSMSVERLSELNPDKINALVAGDTLKIEKKKSFLPIEYTRILQTTSYIDYSSVEVPASNIYVGQTAVITKGEKGEQINVESVHYVDGAESSRELISSEIVKQPVTEEIGIGTYTAQPDSTSTVLSGSGQFAWPVNGGYISSEFGYRGSAFHKGLDIAAPRGTEIYAAADGQVIYAGWDPGGYGNCIRVDHGDGYVTVYAHETDIYVSVGDYVTTGQLIGSIGATGDATGNHLHFEVRYDGIAYNPADYLNVNK